MSNGREIAKNIIIKELENVLAEHQVDLFSARERIRSSLWASENTNNKSDFLDDIAAELREYLSSLEELESGRVRKRKDYVKEQLRRAEEAWSRAKAQSPSRDMGLDDGSIESPNVD